MSSAAVWPGVFLALVARTAFPQTAPAWRDSVQRLSAAYGALRDSVGDRDSTVVEVARRGRMVISASPRERAAARQALEYFAARRERWFGGAVPSPAGFRIAVRTRSGRNVFGRRNGYQDRYDGSIVLSGLPDTSGATRMERAAPLKHTGEQLFTGYAEMMFPTLGISVGKWLESLPPFHLADDARRYHAMYAVMTSTGQAERGCVDGRLDYCAYALGLRPAPSPELTGAFPMVVRADLFLSALETGGSGSWERIVQAGPQSPATALEAATGLPVDSVIARWRHSITSLRPGERPLHLGSAVLAAAWAAVLLAGTLGGSRWR
jgi:hypothetical protein